MYELAQDGTVHRVLGYDRSTSTFVIGTTDTVTGTHFQMNGSGVIKLTSLSVNEAVFTNASKQLVSNAITGSVNVVMSTNPIFDNNLSVGKAAYESWSAAYAVIQAGGNNAIISTAAEGAGSEFGLLQNAYHDGVYKYVSNDQASRYYQIDGTHVFQVAGAGAADAAISWTTSTTIDNSGNILAMPDNNNALHQIGKAKIGAFGSDEAVFAHFDEFTVNNYALKQDSAGNTFVNGASGVYLRYGSAGRVSVMNTKVDILVLLETDNVSMGKSTFEAWNTNYTVCQAGGNGALFANTTEGASAQQVLSQNMYLDSGGNDKYISADEACKYVQQDGGHRWYVTASGVADAAITWGQPVLQFDNARRCIITTVDNDASAFDLKCGAISYIKIDSTNNAEKMRFGQAQNLTEIIEMPETYTDGIHRLVAKKVVTAAAVQTTAATLTLSDDSLYMFLVQIVAMETTTNSEQAQYFLGSAFYRDGGGNATILNGVQTLFSGESDPAFDATMDGNGNDVRVRVTGLAATSVRWVVYINYWKSTLSA